MIYLDNAATTPIDPRVVEAMLPFLTEQFGNPGSLYKLGRDAKAAVEKAREQVAKFMGAKPEQIIFTSGATEANNMVFAMVKPLLEKSGKTSVVTTALEHKSVIRPAQHLSDCGFNVVYLGVPKNNSSIPKDLGYFMRTNPGLVSVMFVNNEIGHANDVNTIGRLCKDHGALFHTDCVQAASMHPINVEHIGCDFATISAHKIHGPKGVGALFVKDKSLFEPMILGGANQEFGMRGGTENVAGIVGFGKACELIIESNTLAELELIEMMQDAFMFTMGDTISKAGFGRPWQLNGGSRYVTKTLSIRVDGIDAESLILMADNAGVCISAGSACNSIEHTPSHVLTAIGLSAEQAKSSFRVSFSRMNTMEEACEAGKIIGECIVTLLGLKHEEA